MIDKTAIIDPRAQISDNVKIGPYSVIGPNVEIGEGTIVQSHVNITGDTKIGYPILVSPVIFTCDWTIVPSPISTFGPITE